MKFDYYLQKKYLQFYLTGIQHRQSSERVWNCRCPVCGDSQKDAAKMRGYFYVYNNDIVYKCHNCEYSAYLPSFLKVEHPTFYKEMVMEAMRGMLQKEDQPVFKLPVFEKKIVLPEFKKIETGSDAWRYLAGRKLEFAAHRFYDIANIKDVSATIPKYKDKQWSFPAIGIPYVIDGKLILLQCRNIGEGMRFASLQISKGMKIFGLDDIDPGQTVSVLEAAFDSCFVRNAVACGGPPDKNVADYLAGRGLRLRFIYDADYSFNREIRRQLDNRIAEGHEVVLFDRHFNVKDMNDAILNGWSMKSLNEYLDLNTFSGAKAKLTLTMRRK